jgi:hypothetical protein
LRAALFFPVDSESAVYGEGVGLGVDWLAFSLSFAAFAVACWRRSESAFSCAASGVLCGLTVVSLLDFEQPAAATTATARIESKKFFIMWK